MYRLTMTKKCILSINYLIDKAVNTGKGANSVSMLHHSLTLGKTNLMHLHALFWPEQESICDVISSLRVLVDFNKRITLSFLIPCHTKFSPD